MPTQKDLKRLVRARMQRTGEAYTAARLQVLKKEPAPDYAKVAGMSNTSVSKKTGRTWAEWVAVLDAARAAEKPHAQIAAHVRSLGTPDWWTQMVTVGYERIRGLRAKGQGRDGGYAAGKSRTFDVPVKRLFNAFANARTRRALQGLPRPLDIELTGTRERSDDRPPHNFGDGLHRLKVAIGRNGEPGLDHIHAQPI